MSNEIDTASAHADDVVGLSYSYRPSLMGAPWEFTLTPQALDWRAGRRGGRVPYAAIHRMRLSFRPVAMQSRRFRAEVWSKAGPKLDVVSSSWRSMVEQVSQDSDYLRFISELHRRVIAAGGSVRYETGTPRLLYWSGVAIFVGCAFGLAALIVRALQVQSYSGAAFIAAFLALFLWQAGDFFRRNRPGPYRPDALPPQVLPKS